MLAPSGYKHFSPNQLQQEKIKFLKSYDLSQQEIQIFLNSMPNSRNVQDLIKKLQLKPYEQQFLQYNVQNEPEYKKYMKPYVRESKGFLNYLNEFELEGEYQQYDPLVGLFKMPNFIPVWNKWNGTAVGTKRIIIPTKPGIKNKTYIVAGFVDDRNGRAIVQIRSENGSKADILLAYTFEDKDMNDVVDIDIQDPQVVNDLKDYYESVK